MPLDQGWFGRVRWRTVERFLGTAAGCLLIALTLLTVIDVIARYAFNAPVRGGYELTELMLGALIFLALPITTAHGEHVEVDLGDFLFGPRAMSAVSRVVGLLSAFILAIFAWRLFVHGLRLAHDGAVTNSLSLPLSPLAFGASLSCALSCVVMLIRSLSRK